MNRFACSKWAPDQIKLLRTLVDSGVSPSRASVVLKRPKLAVQNKARQLGWPFPDIRDVKARRLARETAELDLIERQRDTRTRSKSGSGDGQLDETERSFVRGPVQTACSKTSGV